MLEPGDKLIYEGSWCEVVKAETKVIGRGVNKKTGEREKAIGRSLILKDLETGLFPWKFEMHIVPDDDKADCQ